MQNIYCQLTAEFNRGRVRAILSGGQAVVLHRLAIMSKDGDWILRENEKRLALYLKAAEPWARQWPDVSRELDCLRLEEAQEVMVARARPVLPSAIPGGWG